MDTTHARALKGALLLAPVLATAAEAVRLRVDSTYVEDDVDALADATSRVASVADHLTAWRVAGLLQLAFALTWSLALLAMVLVLARSRPRAALVGGLCALAAAAGTAMHVAFYFMPLSSLAALPDRDLAVRAAAATGDSDPLVAVAIVVFLVGTLLAVLVLGTGLWRAGHLPWWGVAGLVAWLAYAVSGTEAPVAAAANLLLLLPCLAVARALTAPVPDPVRGPRQPAHA